jgi:preprotein translocase subunit SecY
VKSAKGRSSQGGLTELKNRLLFLLIGLLIFRIGAHIPVPGIDPQRLADLFSSQQGTLLGTFNMFSGGALRQFSIFALGVMPYISASIILQLFASVPNTALAQLKKEGESGRRKINQYTRYATLLLAIVQAFGMSKILPIAVEANFVFYFVSTVTLVTGTMFLMWLGEQITERGIGNGISLIIFAGIVANLPSALSQLLEQVRDGQIQGLFLLVLLVVSLAVIGFVVFVERGQRRIRVEYAQRTQGRKVFAAQTSHLPLKINMSGVIPPIFASSLLLIPYSFSQWLGFDWLVDIGTKLQPGNLTYMVVYGVLIIFFAFFYTALVFNPKDTADNLKKSGAFIPGIRPGDQTADYIDGVMTRLTLAGALYLAFVCILPEIFRFDMSVPFFNGTSMLIIVVVLMDFMAQVQSHLMSQQYESLMKKANLRGGPGLPGMKGLL